MRLQVIVRGKNKSGKSTVAKLIRDTLNQHGIQCTWMDQEDSEPYGLDYRKLEGLASREDVVVDVSSETAAVV